MPDFSGHKLQPKERKREGKRKERALTLFFTAHTHFSLMNKYHSVVKTMELILLVREAIVWLLSPEASGAISELCKYIFFPN